MAAILHVLGNIDSDNIDTSICRQKFHDILKPHCEIDCLAKVEDCLVHFQRNCTTHALIEGGGISSPASIRTIASNDTPRVKCKRLHYESSSESGRAVANSSDKEEEAESTSNLRNLPLKRLKVQLNDDNSISVTLFQDPIDEKINRIHSFCDN
jgi:hypothetical protein